MKSRVFQFLSFAAILLIAAHACYAQTPARTYQQMSTADQSKFISEQSRSIAKRISGSDYEFTAEFETYIRQWVDHYQRRIGNNGGDRLWKGDVRFILERGQSNASTLMSAFGARGVSPLMGLYIPFIESEYVNIQAPNSVGAIGMFQFLPKTGERYGLTREDLLDVGKSADAAARYISDNLANFKTDPMKEALALLAYNRGEKRVAMDLELVVTGPEVRCSICAITSARARLDESFRSENGDYVPRFFAAAIIGENPEVFSLHLQPLSSLQGER
ncbi:MAG: transglycosylase SLT domain-containing protein [Pyrinomonadaceae bacterium]